MTLTTIATPIRAPARARGFRPSGVTDRPSAKSRPAAMRFAWNKAAAPNLMNMEGLPVSAFRSGKVPKIDILSLEVPEAKDYQLLYTFDLTKADAQMTASEDRGKQIAGPIDRVAYFLELKKEGQPAKWVFVSMDAFTGDLSGGRQAVEHGCI